MDHDTMQLNCRDAEPETIVLDEAYGKEVFKQQSLHFLDSVRQGDVPECTAEDGLRALEVSHAILESSSQGREVSLQRS